MNGGHSPGEQAKMSDSRLLLAFLYHSVILNLNLKIIIRMLHSVFYSSLHQTPLKQ